MNNLEYEQFKVEAEKRHIAHLKLMERDRVKKFDWTHLLDKHNVQGEERERFLATQSRVHEIEGITVTDDNREALKAYDKKWGIPWCNG